jgi:hypothetical protein
MQIQEKHLISALIFLYSAKKEQSIQEFDGNSIHSLRIPYHPGEVLKNLLNLNYVTLSPQDASFGLKRKIFLTEKGKEISKLFIPDCENIQNFVSEAIHKIIDKKNQSTIQEESIHFPLFTFGINNHRIKFAIEFDPPLHHLRMNICLDLYKSIPKENIVLLPISTIFNTQIFDNLLQYYIEKIDNDN